MIRGSKRSKRATLVAGTALVMLTAAFAVNVVPSAAVDPPPQPIAAAPWVPLVISKDANFLSKPSATTNTTRRWAC